MDEQTFKLQKVWLLLERGGGGGGRETDEVMAEIAQLGSQETKAINFESGSFQPGLALPHLSEDMRDRQQSVQ